MTRFGAAVDVRHRGVLRIPRFAGGQRDAGEAAPAVVRLWANQQCQEMTVREARELAGQLIAAATLAEQQNGH